jgi:diphosphomevalonate decarboxylase
LEKVIVLKIATCEATPNIAVVKYWGKRDDKLILPQNSSLSFTMDETLKTRTTVAFSPDFKEDELWLNGQKMDLRDKETAERFQQLEVVRQKAGMKYKAKIVSLNCFPTAAGFASSAAGLAALACASSKAAGLDLPASELSILARLGSGSACRSVLGGFVEWRKGEKTDGSDSFAAQVASEEHWPEIRNVISVVEAGRKKISSRSGMKQTVATSALYKARLDYLPKVIEEMKKAVLEKNLPKFCELTMRESDSMHAVMLDTWPPIKYMNDYSWLVVNAVNEFNDSLGSLEAAYTFDAGPNAHVYTVEKHVPALRKILSELEGVQKTLVCKVGSGPKYLTGEKEHLVSGDGKAKSASYDEKTGKITVK